MSFEENVNDRYNLNEKNQKHISDKKYLKSQGQLLEDSEYSSEQEIIENNSMDIDISFDEEPMAPPRLTKTKNCNIPLTEHLSKNKKQLKNKNKNKKNKLKKNETDKQITFSKERMLKLKIPIPHVKRIKMTPSEAANDLFQKAIKTSKQPILSQKPNSTRAAEKIYEKFVNQNEPKSNNIDLYSKIQDEEILQNREMTRTKENIKIINDLLNRQEEFEKNKLNKLKEKEKEVNDKKFQECIFNPNGIYTTSRTIKDFYDEQIKFVEKKDDNIKKLTNDIENEKNKTNSLLISKISDKLASKKNPNESKEQLYNRLAAEKLGLDSKINENENNNNKKMTKEELQKLSNKLYKEGQTLKNNLDKKRKEIILQEEKNNKKEFALEKSNKVILDKLISSYDKILYEIFNQTNNFEISFEEYKTILYRLGCIKPNSISDENLLKDSFYNYLKPTNNKISTYSFLLFMLAAFGIYKGNDEKIVENKNNKNKNKTSIELIKIYIPDLEFEKYGFNNKIAKNIKLKFIHFITGVNEMWADDLIKKKQERQDKTEEFLKQQEQQKKIENRERLNNLLAENLSNTNIENKKGKNMIKSTKLEDNYLRIQKIQKQNISLLKAKYDAKELENCTFQPNILAKSVNKNQISKNIEKLYVEGKKSYIKKKQISEKDRDENDDNIKNCTFKPQLHHYNKQVFNNNPLKEDKKYNNKIQKMIKLKRARNKKIEKHMNFSLEPKINKESIFERINSKKSDQIKNCDNIEIKGYNFKEGLTPLFKIEVNLDEKNNSDMLFIYPGDDVIKVTNNFCSKHKLNEEKKHTLLMTILEKIQENDNIRIKTELKNGKIKKENNKNYHEKNDIMNEIIHDEEENSEKNEINNEGKIIEQNEENIEIDNENQNKEKKEEEKFEQNIDENEEQNEECDEQNGLQNEGESEEEKVEKNENEEIQDQKYAENIDDENEEENNEQNGKQNEN